MTRFRERSTGIGVKAFQWWGEEVPGFNRISVGLDELSGPHFNLMIPSPDGTRYAAEGDWIVIGPDGWIRRYDPEEFATVYVAVELPS